MVIELLEEVRAHAAARAAGDTVGEDEPLEAVAVVRLAVNHVDNLRAVFLAPREAFSPVVPRAGLGVEDVLRVEEVPVRTTPEAVLHHAGLQVQQQRPRNVVPVVGLIEEDVLAVAPVRRELAREGRGEERNDGCEERREEIL